jgi:Family of unknown function (DUF5994)
MIGSDHQQTRKAGPGGRPGARLDFDLDRSNPTVLDGAWWPRSRDAAAELADLITTLDARRVRINLVMLNPDGWLGHPRWLQVAGRTVRVSWFRTLDTAVLIATTDSRQRIDLLVSIVDTATHPALAALLAADDQDDEYSADIIQAAL